ncbi:ABC transporter B family member 29, chloroplastic [Dendrobium catenatum]|uniref:ABC transporter B family member 29, chloroplastic n=1 Tax=Dendrobium catenatum TaxID=906689 RepID=A0A2I0VLR1_9ASPA|nr:ABC transporter B family member 29, chloroplastic [Dendrobium catenatum]
MAQLFYRTCSLSPLHSPPSFSSSKTQTLFAPITPSPFPYPLPFSSSSSKLFCLDPLRFQSPRFSSSSSFDRIKPYLQSEWEPILKGWVCSVVSVCCLSVAVPKAGQIPSILTSVGSDRMVAEGLALATLAFARSAATYLQHAFLWEAALGAAFRIRAYVFGRVIESDLGFFEGNAGVEAGDVAHRLTSEASDVADMLYSLLNTVVPNTLQFLVMATQMVMLSPPLAFVSALGVPCLLLVIGYLGERLRGISRRAQITAAKLSSYVNEVCLSSVFYYVHSSFLSFSAFIVLQVLPLMLVVKANNGELNENLHFCRLAHDDLIARLGKKKLKAVIPQIVQVIYIGGLIVLHAISLNALKGSMDGSRLLSFTMSLALLIDPIQGMGKAFNELKEGEPAVERLFELAQFHNKVVEKPNALDLCHVTGDIKFSGVTFRYGDNMPLILNELDILIKRGDIFLDDYNIQEVKLRNLREHIVLIPQDTMLFLGTVAENIGYKDASGKLDMECVENAAKIANADEFIRELPNGYQTNIGLRGSLLSGGQRQRIAIARALYRKSSILILDEATSALDSKSEQLFSQALEPLMTNNTVLIIAHRIETMMMADRVLLVEGGKVEEVPKSSILSPDGHLASLLNS